MKYTEEVKQALSRKVAEKHKIAPFIGASRLGGGKWLYQDEDRLKSLCDRFGIYVRHSANGYEMASAFLPTDKNTAPVSAKYADCVSASEAERIALLLALAEV